MDSAFPDSCLILPFLLTWQRVGGELFLKCAAQVAQRTVGRRVCNLIRMRLHLVPLACPTPFLAVAWPPIGDTWDPSRLATGAGGGRQHRGLNTSGELMGVQSREAEQGSQFYLFYFSEILVTSLRSWVAGFSMTAI